MGRRRVVSELCASTVASPLGPLELLAEEDALVGVLLPAQHPCDLRAVAVPSHPVLDRAKLELEEYFRGDRRVFSVPISLAGTGFQCAVWRALCKIPFGERRSYGSLASELGRPRAARAVGAANGQNPIAIIVPCHRVVGSDGALTGYAGGLEIKR
jgi:methylated-DNA-[protein]-cysteine S-methyltransferase